MSYSNPEIYSISNPQGIDKVIESIRIELATLTWLEKSFGRAWEFKEKDPSPESNRIIKVPKVWIGKDADTKKGEYMNVLPNDNLKSQSFISCRNEETWLEYDKSSGNHKQRELSIIFWFDLRRIDDSKGYIFTEVLKKDVEKKLKANKYIKSVNAFFDERAEDVFDGYISAAQMANYTVDDPNTQYLMYPYSGFRFDVTVNYNEEC